MTTDVQDKNNKSFVLDSDNEWARRVIVSDPVSDVSPDEWKGLAITATSLTDIWKFYSDVAKTNLILTVTVTYSDADKDTETGVTRVTP